MYKTVKKSSKKDKLMNIYIDLEPLITDMTSDQAAGNAVLSQFQPIQEFIGIRMKQVKRLEMAYDTPSVALYNQAKDLYILGYFFSSIVICRSTVEYLAFEIFSEEVKIEGDTQVLESIAENLDFRKIVNEFLYKPDKGYEIIDKETSKKFNELYDLGNKWVHPKEARKDTRIEDDAFNAIKIVGELIESLRGILRDYDISEGRFEKKSDARVKVRPIKLNEH